jgi:hypothetical protein
LEVREGANWPALKPIIADKVHQANVFTGGM